jgi:hypothetical protein
VAGRSAVSASRRAPRAQRAGEAQRLERDADKVRTAARHEERQPAFRRVARGGLIARTVVYLMIGALSLEVAVVRHSGVAADSQGAFDEIARQPGGRALLGVLAVGLIAYAAWRVIEAIAGNGLWPRLGWLASGVLYLALFVEAIEILAGHASSDPSEHPQPIVARLLRIPAGPELVGAIGVAIAAAGFALVVWGIVHDYDKILEARRMPPWSRRFARVLGIAGDASRGLAVVLVASYLLDAAVADDPADARGASSALQSLVSLPAGRGLLGLLAAGLLAYAAYSAAEVCYRRV